MARMFEVIDYHEERRRRTRIRLATVTVLISLALFSFPHIKAYMPKWEALTAARKLALYVQELRTQSVLTKKPFEIRFIPPNTVEIYEVASCGVGGGRTKKSVKELSEFGNNVEFLSADTLRQYASETNETILKRFCYDPVFGSSLPVDGLLHAAVFLAYSPANEERIVQLSFVGSNGDIEIQ